MNLILVGLNHKTAGVAIREKLSFSDETLPEAFCKLLQQPEIDETLILSTCNRVEVTAAVKDTSKGFDDIVSYLTETFSLDREMLIPHLYFYSAGDAIKHIFRVTSSLDSLVVGEAQILGQVKDAFETALIHKASSVLLNKIYKKAISVAKRVRTETAISRFRVSISSVGVELAEKIFETLKNKTVFILGAGEMAELALKHLIEGGADKIIISTRDFQKAESLAKEYQGTAIEYENFLSKMTEADIVICSTGAPYYLITPEAVKGLIKERKNSPIFMIDISVPRNIDPAVNDIDDVFLYDIDDLNAIVAENVNERAVEARQAEKLIVDEVTETAKWVKSLDVVPTIVDIKEKGEKIRKEELAKLFSKTKELEPAQIKAIEALTSSIINKLLHAPVVMLKKQSENADGNLYVEAARKLFNLDHDLGAGCKRKDKES